MNPQHDPHTRPRARRFVFPLIVAGVAAALLAAGILPRLRAQGALAAQVATQSAQTVSVIEPKLAPATQELLLPGAVTAFSDAAIYARTSGYVQHWYTDIGAHVKKGQVLADIQTPELDAQLQQAHADEATAQANFNYAKATAQRWQDMLKTQSVSQQDADTKTGDMLAKRAMLQSAQANVQRLTELVSYEKVVAPFDGVVTARNVDVGALVTAGGAPGLAASAGELFHVAQRDTLRVFIEVPQNDAPYVSASTQAYLTVQQFPGRQFAAHVARSSGAMDPVSRTLRVEVDVDNQDGTLLPGAYAQVHLALQNGNPALDLPVSALLFRPNGVTIATVDATGKTALKSVTVGRDFGTHVEILTGLQTSDRVIDNPGDALASGEPVKIAKAGHAS
ncbi:efflux RND transporter periplasmic adaptor subunit [Caballeronia concitans]|uniref:RND family efflux transporter MFP subunit n=1 Tax=Caballeronia concitans TaxID=1777133 RepID=A0A658QX36_9BURK|nr:efflux RND transporter periplasmic adaptor subunit [Caballeronia concitans]KIG02968.1 efflux transporter, RND family, MFP subunit [Burkholderia sp. MR1]SAL30208.1 RND family efflux transporter MFP subunit [Caballeronia concitans]